MTVKDILHYLNPIARMGQREYSIVFPTLFMIGLCAISEIIAYGILKDPNAVGLYAIFVFVAMIIYFAFRDGIRAGFIASFITVIYYFYIIYTRHYTGQQLTSGIQTTVVLGALYFLLAGIIGWLKQTIDSLIEREANEKRRLQTIVQQLPVGVIVTNRDGTIELANKQADNILGIKVPIGYTFGDQPFVKSYRDGKQTLPSQSLITQSLSSGKTITDKEYTIQRPDGKRIHILASSSPIRGRDRKVVAAAVILNDITAQKEMEKRKDDFVNMASHELKTPITSMKLYIDSLVNRIKQYDDQRLTKTIHSIKYQTTRLQKLVSDLLDVSRLQTGKLTFTKDTLRLDELVEETIEELQGTTDKQILYKVRTPIKLTADKFRIYQVLTNLITNAIKYSPEGKEIIVRLKRQNGKSEISIQDFGIGIEKSQQKKVFERLYQVTDDTEKTFPGFGMGLYISREIVKRHHGTIWVESEKGKGSTFYFTLPLDK